MSGLQSTSWRPSIFLRQMGFELLPDLQDKLRRFGRRDYLCADRATMWMWKAWNVEGCTTKCIYPAAEHALGDAASRLAADRCRTLKMCLPSRRCRCRRYQSIEGSAFFAGLRAKLLPAIKYPSVVDRRHVQALLDEIDDLIGRICSPANKGLRYPRRANRRQRPQIARSARILNGGSHSSTM